MSDHQGIGITIQSGGRPISFHTPVLSRNISRMPPEKLADAAYDLHGLIADYCGYLAEILYMDPDLQEELFARLQEARKKIDLPKDPDDQKVTLNEAIFEIHRVHVRIAKDQELLIQKTRLRWISPVLVLVYVFIIIGIIFLGHDLGTSFMLPVVGIPLSVLLWSLIGSVTAILFRFYTYRMTKLTQVSPQVTWLIARPLTGIIMGTVSYIAIVAGLFVFGAETPSIVDTPMVRPQLLWIVAFLAGFSDRFFEGFIRTLIFKLSSPVSESHPNDSDKETESGSLP